MNHFSSINQSIIHSKNTCELLPFHERFRLFVTFLRPEKLRNCLSDWLHHKTKSKHSLQWFFRLWSVNDFHSTFWSVFATPHERAWSFTVPDSVVDFNPLSTNPARLQPISYLTRLKFKVTTLKVLTRLNNLGCNLSWVATRWVGNGLNLKNQKFKCIDHL